MLKIFNCQDTHHSSNTADTKLTTPHSQLSYEPDNKKHYIILCFLVKCVFLKL